MLAAPPPPLPEAIADARADGAPFPYASPDGGGAPSHGGTLRLAASAALPPWDAGRPAGAWLAIAPLVQEPLLTLTFAPARQAYAPRPQPALAAAWERTPDGLLYTFTLRDHVLWAGAAAGGSLLAADIVASLQAALEPDAVIAAADARTVTLRLVRPDADLLVTLSALSIVPHAAAPFPLGSGPFAVERIEGDAVRLRAHAAHWRGAPALDGIVVHTGLDARAQRAAFAAGAIDAGDALPATVADADGLLRERPDTVVTASPVLATASSWAFDLTDARFADERVRRALALALDRARIREEVHRGHARHVPTQAWPFVFDRPPGSAELGRWHRYDPREARALLDAAGAARLRLTVASSSGAPPASADESLLMVEMLRAIGVDAHLEAQPAATFDERWRTASFDAVADGRAAATPSATAFFHDQVVTRYAGRASLNHWRIADPQLDAWAAEQRAELDAYARRDLLRRIWDRLQDRVYRLDKAQPFPLTARPARLRCWNASPPFAATDVAPGWARPARARGSMRPSTARDAPYEPPADASPGLTEYVLSVPTCSRRMRGGWRGFRAGTGRYGPVHHPPPDLFHSFADPRLHLHLRPPAAHPG